MEAVTLCQLKSIPFCFKSVITNFNKEELTELALLGANLESQEQGFLQPIPTPRSIREGVIPPPEEIKEKLEWVAGSLAKALRPKIFAEGVGPQTIFFSCPNILKGVNLDFQGNLVLCCNLSHVTREEGLPSIFGQEWLGNLKEITLREGLVRHFQGVAHLIEARLRDMEKFSDLMFIPCYWCYRHFGKFEWLRDFPESPWAAGMLRGER